MARADRSSRRDDRSAQPSVDFLVGEAGDDAETDEELPQPDPAQLRARRLRARVAVGALALLVAVLIGRALLAPDRAPQAQTEPTTTDSSTPSITLSHEPPPTGPVTAPPLLYNGHLPQAPSSTASTRAPHPPFPTSLPRRRGDDPTACRGRYCSASTRIPASVTAAVQDAFPESQLEQVETLRLRDGDLWFREIDARVGSQRLILRVQAPAKGDRTRSGRRTANSLHTTFLETSLGPWHVEVDVVDLLGGEVPAGPLRALAGDPRIVSG